MPKTLWARKLYMWWKNEKKIEKKTIHSLLY